MGTITFKTQDQIEQERLESWRESCKISRFQARHTLRVFGLLDMVEDYMASNEASDLEKDAWADAQEFRYNSPMINTLCAAFGIDSEMKDQLFRYGESVEA